MQDTERNVAAVEAMAWLFRAYNAAVTRIGESLRPLGLSPSAFNALIALHDAPDQRLEPCQLSERLLVSRPSVTGLLDTLQTKGLVVREPHQEDGRRVLVHLTDAARALLDEHMPAHFALHAQLLADLSHDEHVQLAMLLRRVASLDAV